MEMMIPGNDSDDVSNKHKLFRQQMEELQLERQTLFGNEEGNSDSILTKTTTSSSAERSNDNDNDNYLLFTKQQMADLQQEREELFGFTEHDRKAWGNASSAGHKHDASFMEQIRLARQEQQQQQQEESCTQHDLLPASLEMNLDDDDDIDTSGCAGSSSSATSTTATGLAHVASDGQSMHMVDVGSKAVTRRTATARSTVVFPEAVLTAFRRNGSSTDLVGPKGPIFATAVLAGIMAAKQTSNLIPLCHPLPLEKVHVNITWQSQNSIVIECTAVVTHKTGVEMEALTGASVAALTVYDMVKAVSHDVCITDMQLVHKHGGKRTIDKR